MLDPTVFLCPTHVVEKARWGGASFFYRSITSLIFSPFFNRVIIYVRLLHLCLHIPLANDFLESFVPCS
jgi:hypothetical protein